ncbi:FAD-binding oxidoreductase [Chloroflexota bacterium]
MPALKQCYDLRKLFLGSWGTLGVITKAILKLSHLPEDHNTLLLTFSSIRDALRVTRDISNSVLRPESMELIDAKAARLEQEDHFELQKDELLLLIKIAGSREEVRRHLSDIQTLAEANNARAINILSGDEEDSAWASQRQVQQYSAPDLVRGKAVVPIDKIGDMFQEIEKTASRRQLQTAITGRAGSGILYPRLFTKEPAASNDEVLAAIAELSRSAEKLSGFFLVESGPAQVRQAVDPVQQRSDHGLTQRLKQTFDPKNIFNPGKLVRTL